MVILDDEETNLHANELVIGAPRNDTLPRRVTTYTTGKTFAVVYAQALDAASLLFRITPNPAEVVSAKWFDPAQCVIEPETSDRGVICIRDTGDGTIIEGATADVVAALFATLQP